MSWGCSGRQWEARLLTASDPRGHRVLVTRGWCPSRQDRFSPGVGVGWGGVTCSFTVRKPPLGVLAGPPLTPPGRPGASGVRRAGRLCGESVERRGRAARAHAQASAGAAPGRRRLTAKGARQRATSGAVLPPPRSHRWAGRERPGDTQSCGAQALGHPPRGGTRTSRGQRGSGAGGGRAGSAQLQRRLSAARTPLPVVVNTLSVRVCMCVHVCAYVGVHACVGGACVCMCVHACAHVCMHVCAMRDVRAYVC